MTADWGDKGLRPITQAEIDADEADQALVAHLNGRLQPPIHFGGVQLPEVTRKGAVCSAPGADEVPIGQNDARTIGGLQPFPGPTAPDHGTKAAYASLAYGQEPHGNPPAGEATPEARLVNVSRMALAARIKHGVPLADLLAHFQTLAMVETKLMGYE